MSRTGVKGDKGNPFTKTKSLIPSWAWAIVDGFFALVAGAALAATAIGGWIAWVTSFFIGIPIWLLSLFGVVVPVADSTLLSIVVAGMLLILVLDLLDTTADKPALVCLLLMPSLALHAAGPVAEVGMLITGGGQDLGAATLGRLLGG